MTGTPTQEEAREAVLDARREYLLALGDEGGAEQVSPEVIGEERQAVLGAWIRRLGRSPGPRVTRRRG